MRREASVGSRDAPEHSGLFQPLAVHSVAGYFDRAGADRLAVDCDDIIEPVDLSCYQPLEGVAQSGMADSIPRFARTRIVQAIVEGRREHLMRHLQNRFVYEKVTFEDFTLNLRRRRIA